MADPRIQIVGDVIYKKFGTALNSLSAGQSHKILSRALYRGGNQARTQVRRSLVSQTGIKYGLINKAIKHTYKPSQLEYTLAATGDHTNISLFNARQVKKGVSAAPWKKRRIFKGSFLIAGYGGKAFLRTTDERGPLSQLFGPNIAVEMTRGETLKAWESAKGFILARVEHELIRYFNRR